MSGEKKLMRKKGKESTREKDKKAKIKSFNGKRKKNWIQRENAAL